MKFSIYSYLNRKEIDIIKWIYKNHFTLLLFLVPSGCLIVLSNLPYFNLFIKGSFVYILIVVWGLIVFKISMKLIVRLFVATVLISAFFSLFRLYIPATNIFNFAFAISFVAFLKFINPKF